MGNYIRAPLTYEQSLELDKILQITKDLLPGHRTFLAGSYALKLFLGKPQGFSNDIDICVDSVHNVYDWYTRIVKKRPCFTSPFAVNLGIIEADDLPMQIIPMTIGNIEHLLDTFDLTSSAIGIELGGDTCEFVVHKDIFAGTFGLPTKFKFTTPPNLSLFFRAIKYAKKFDREVAGMFPAFDYELERYWVNNATEIPIGEFRDKVFKTAKTIKNMQNYEDNEVLATILRGHRIRFGGRIEPIQVFDGGGRDFVMNAEDARVLRNGGWEANFEAEAVEVNVDGGNIIRW